MRYFNALYLVVAHGLCISIASAGYDRSRTQFIRFFPTVEEFAKPRFHKACPEEFANYFNESLPDPDWGHEYSIKLMDCVLEEFGELNMANMAVTAILLALLPAGLVQFGPSMAELSVLSARRPLLATLLGFGLMSPNPTEFEFEAILEKARNGGAPLIPLAVVEGGHLASKIVISFLEYGIAMAATANNFFQIYQFTYRAVSLAPLVVYLPGLPETATLFGWAFLSLPIYLICFAVFALAFRQTTSKLGFNKRRNHFVELMRDELTPCAQGRQLNIERRENRQALQKLLGGLIRLIAGLHIILGTVLIGSIVLIPLADSLPVIYTFVFAAVFTRGILTFELNGLARQTNIDSSERVDKIKVQAQHSLGYESHISKPERYEGLRQSE